MDFWTLYFGFIGAASLWFLFYMTETFGNIARRVLGYLGLVELVWTEDYDGEVRLRVVHKSPFGPSYGTRNHAKQVGCPRSVDPVRRAGWQIKSDMGRRFLLTTESPLWYDQSMSKDTQEYTIESLRAENERLLAANRMNTDVADQACAERDAAVAELAQLRGILAKGKRANWAVVLVTDARRIPEPWVAEAEAALAQPNAAALAIAAKAKALDAYTEIGRQHIRSLYGDDAEAGFYLNPHGDLLVELREDDVTQHDTPLAAIEAGGAR